MTLILGINLTDSVYLAADTRVTRQKGERVVDMHDNLFKLWSNADGVSCAVAGDAGLAQYLLRELRYQSFSRRGIDSVREHIEEFVYTTADKYWRDKKTTTDATLMFAGSSPHKRAYIETSLVNKLIAEHTNNEDAQSELSDKFFRYQQIANGSIKKHRTKLQNTSLFAVQVSPFGVRVTDSAPGEHLIYGSPGLVKEDVQLKEIARIEFGSDNNSPMLMTAYINLMREKRQLQGVSTTVVPIHILHDGTVMLITGSTYSVEIENDKPVIDTVSSISASSDNNQIYRIENGQKIPLTPVESYDCNVDAMTMLRL